MCQIVYAFCCCVRSYKVVFTSINIKCMCISVLLVFRVPPEWCRVVFWPFKERKKYIYFPQNLSVYCMCACMFVSVGIFKRKMLIIYSVFLGCRGHCVLSPLWKLKCSASNGWGAGMATWGRRGRGAHSIASVWVIHLTVGWGCGKKYSMCWCCKELKSFNE